MRDVTCAYKKKMGSEAGEKDRKEERVHIHIHTLARSLTLALSLRSLSSLSRSLSLARSLPRTRKQRPEVVTRERTKKEDNGWTTFEIIL